MANNADDKELNDLLDDALEDFDKQTENDAPAVAPKTETLDDFFLEQSKMFGARMQTLFGGAETPSGDLPPLPQDPEKVLAGFKKMAELTKDHLRGGNTPPEEMSKYSETISNALNSLQEGADHISNPIKEEDVANMFSSLNLDMDNADGNPFLPFMEAMMQSLLSSEILLPTIKELLEKYPKYLESNDDKLSDEEKKRYKSQMDYYKHIEGLLEKEDPNASPAAKREQYKVVLDAMRKLQDYGNPPEEILSQCAGDLSGMIDPSLEGAGDGPQCSMM